MQAICLHFYFTPTLDADTTGSMSYRRLFPAHYLHLFGKSGVGGPAENSDLKSSKSCSVSIRKSVFKSLSEGYPDA